MKKVSLLLTLLIAVFASKAQTITVYTLTGTSYSQNFDAIGSGLPAGWNMFNTATSTSLGTLDGSFGSGGTTFGSYWDTTDCPSDVFGHGFKNSASADNGHTMANSTCSLQESQTNRALGMRQAAYAGWDPGPSFAFQMANTAMDSDFTLTFNLQSLDSMAPRTTIWTLDYGLGATPTVFTPISVTGTMITGNNTFANNAITATLPAAINQQNQPVWIRISTLSPTTGTWLRTTSAIDDFNLTWHTAMTTGITNVTTQNAVTLTVLGMAASDKVTFVYSTQEEGAYTLSIYDLSGRTLHTETVNAQTGKQTIAVNGLNLVPGMYIAKIQNSNSSTVARIAVN